MLPQCRGETIPKAELARTRNFPPLILNERFFLFCWKSVMEFLYSVPWIGYFPVIVSYLNPRSIKRNKNIWNRRVFLILYLENVSAMHFGTSVMSLWGFPGNTPCWFAKGILLSSKLVIVNSLYLAKGKYICSVKGMWHPQAFHSPPLFCPLPFLCFPSTLEHTFSEYLGGLFWRVFAFDFSKCQQAQQQLDLRQQNESSLQGDKDFFLCRQEGERDVCSLPLFLHMLCMVLSGCV